MLLLFIKAAFIFTSLVVFLLITNPMLFKRGLFLFVNRLNPIKNTSSSGKE